MVVGSSQAGPSISESSPGFTENGLKKDKRQFSELKKGLLMPEKIGHAAYS